MALKKDKGHIGGRMVENLQELLKREKYQEWGNSLTQKVFLLGWCFWINKFDFKYTL